MVINAYPHIHNAMLVQGGYGFARSQATASKLRASGFFGTSFRTIVGSQEGYNSRRLREYVVSVILEIILERYRYKNDKEGRYVVGLTPMDRDLLGGYDMIIGRHEQTRLEGTKSCYIAVDITESPEHFRQKVSVKRDTVELSHFTHRTRAPLYIMYVRNKFIKNILDWTEYALKERGLIDTLPLKSQIGFSLHRYLTVRKNTKTILGLERVGGEMSSPGIQFPSGLSKISTVGDIKNLFHTDLASPSPR